jgi:hypothetical protein
MIYMHVWSLAFPDFFTRATHTLQPSLNFLWCVPVHGSVQNACSSFLCYSIVQCRVPKYCSHCSKDLCS